MEARSVCVNKISHHGNTLELHQDGTLGKASGRSRSNASQPSVGSGSVSSIDCNKTQRTVRARQHMRLIQACGEEARRASACSSKSRNMTMLMLASACVCAVCVCVCTWTCVGGVCVNVHTGLCLCEWRGCVCVYMYWRTCVPTTPKVWMCVYMCGSLCLRQLSAQTCCICSQGCLLPWTVTWDFVFYFKFQYSQGQVQSMAYSRCSINVCWTELD